MRHSASSEHRQETDYIYLGIVYVLVFCIVSLGIAELGLQHVLLQPDDSVFLGPTSLGWMMCLVSTALSGLVASFMAAWPLTRLIRRSLGMSIITPPFPVAPWGRLLWQSVDWKQIEGIAVVILVLGRGEGLWELLLRDRKRHIRQDAAEILGR